MSFLQYRSGPSPNHLQLRRRCEAPSVDITAGAGSFVLEAPRTEPSRRHF